MIKRYNGGSDLVPIPHPQFLTHEDVKLRLKPICRMTIREHLLHLDLHTHLFDRVQKLDLPAALRDYLLFNMSLKHDPDFNRFSNEKQT